MKIKLITLLLLWYSSSFSIDKINIAVVDFEGRGIKKHEAQSLTDKLRIELIKTGKYSVIERNEMTEILKEQEFQQTGCTTQECIVEMGQLIGVRKIIAGSIGKVGSIFFISMRIINVESGKIEKMFEEEIEESIDYLMKYGIKNIVDRLRYSTDELIEKGHEAFVNRNYKKAIYFYKRAIEYDDNLIEAFFYTGKAYIQLNEKDESKNNFYKAIQIQPQTDYEFVIRGESYWYLGMYEEAKKDYTEAIKINPKYGYAYLQRGEIFERQAGYNGYLKAKGEDVKKKWEYEQAIKDFSKAIEIYPKDEYAYYKRGNLYLDLKNYREAINDFTKSITIDPKDVLAYEMRGDAYLELGLYDKAFKDHKQVIKILEEREPVEEREPFFVGKYSIMSISDTWRNKADKAEDNKDFKLAIFLYSKAIILVPEEESNYCDRGDIYLELKQYEKAIKDYNKAIILDPEEVRNYWHRGEVFFELKQYEKAIKDCNKAIALKKNYTLPYNLKARIYIKLDNKEKAFNEINKSIKIDPYYGYSFKARMDKELLLFEDAIKDYSKLLQILEEDQKYFDTTSTIKKEERRKRMLIYKNEKLRTYYFRAEVYLKIGENEKAVNDFNKCLELDWNNKCYADSCRVKIKKLGHTPKY